MNTRQNNQGEGNREADKEYRDRTRSFVESEDVDEAAEKAQSMSSSEAAAAERAGKAKAKELDPAVHRTYDGTEN